MATLGSGTTIYFLPEQLGSTVLLTDSNQNTARVTQYLPFGNIYETSGTADDDHRFTGQRLDAATGLYYYAARYYDDLAGRFVTPDLVVGNPYDPQALNRLSYVRNNPLIYIDPTGNSFLGGISNAFSSITNAISNDVIRQIRRPEGLLFFGLNGFIPQVNSFSYKNRYYIAAVELTVVTAGAAAPGIGAALSGTALTFSQTVALGALSGEVTAGLTTNPKSGNGEALFRAMVVQATLSAAEAGAGYEISEGVSNFVDWGIKGQNQYVIKGAKLALDLGIMGALGGAAAAAQHQDFSKAFIGTVENDAVIGAGVAFLQSYPQMEVSTAKSIFGPGLLGTGIPEGATPVNAAQGHFLNFPSFRR